MKPTITVEDIGGQNLERANKLLAGIPGGVRQAVKWSLIRAGRAGETEAGRFAAREYTITKQTFMKNVRYQSKIRGGAPGGGILSLEIEYAGKVLPLLTFNTSYSRGGRVRVQVKRASAGAVLDHAFAARVFGPMGIFERVGRPRFPVQQLYGPGTAHMMRNERVIDQMDEKIRETYEKRMETEINRILNGWGG